jgi:diadenosine tetraphosphate (Ap4A) HIT family hydrolase
MRTLIHERVEQARSGDNPKVIAKMTSGWAVLGDVQFLRGYCLLLPDPVVPHLNAMSRPDRDCFLNDMATLGDAVLKVTNAVRINYEMLGNVDPALHAHVFPRYDNEPEALRKKPVWFYDWDTAQKFDKSLHTMLMTEIADALKTLGNDRR